AVTCPPATLAQIRKLLFCGRAKEAQDLADHALQGNPRGQASYQTIGELHLDFPGHEQGSGYRRDLDLDSATASVSYRVGETTFHREIFVSPVDQVVAVRLTADRPEAITFTAGFTTPQPATIGTAEGRTLFLRGHNGDLKTRKEDRPVSGGLTFESRLAVQTEGGSIGTGNDTLTVTGATSVTLLIASATSYVNYHDISADPITRNTATLSAVAGKPFTAIRAAHLADHRRLFRRVSLDLGTSPAAQDPTDVRIRNATRRADPALASLYFQFGRYLLISCSRPGGQPANLQGLWNQDLQAPWGGKYTININTEMNYWPAYVANLAEVDEPLQRLVREIAETGARTAKET
ncbi:MAG: glycoside hydrolase family 95 protein, partial [Mycobacterium sp.]